MCLDSEDHANKYLIEFNSAECKSISGHPRLFILLE